MRRRLDYQAAADEPDAFAAVFGLRTWPATDADARTARPIWTAAVDPFVLIATARPCSRDEGNFDLARVRECSTMAASADGEHWLFGTAARALRLDIRSGSLCGGTVALTVHVARLRSEEHTSELQSLMR